MLRLTLLLAGASMALCAPMQEVDELPTRPSGGPGDRTRPSGGPGDRTRPSGSPGDRTRPSGSRPSRPTRSMPQTFCTGKCDPGCADGEMCILSWKTRQCACQALPTGFPTFPHRSTTPKTKTNPTPHSNQTQCSHIANAPTDESSCLAWASCKNHRRIPKYVPATPDGVAAQCCCDIPPNATAGGDNREQCCALSTSKPAATCSSSNLMQCYTPFTELTTACASAIAQSKNCDPNAASGPDKDACTAVYNCVMKNLSPSDFNNCCACIDEIAKNSGIGSLDIPCN